MTFADEQLWNVNLSIARKKAKIAARLITCQRSETIKTILKAFKAALKMERNDDDYELLNSVESSGEFTGKFMLI